MIRKMAILGAMIVSSDHGACVAEVAEVSAGSMPSTDSIPAPVGIAVPPNKRCGVKKLQTWHDRDRMHSRTNTYEKGN